MTRVDGRSALRGSLAWTQEESLLSGEGGRCNTDKMWGSISHSGCIHTWNEDQQGLVQVLGCVEGGEKTEGLVPFPCLTFNMKHI